MRIFVWGFIAGAISCIGFLLFMLCAYPYIEYWGPCPELTKQESKELILRDATTSRKFSWADRDGYDDVELVEDEPGYGLLVYTKKEGKRLSRYAPIVTCGSLEWTQDPDFKPE